MQTTSLLVLAGLLAGSCASVPDGASQPKPAPETAPETVTQEPEEGPLAERVEFKTADDVLIVGDYYPPSYSDAAQPALLLLHGGNRYKERWVESGFVEDFAGADYHVLAIDIRGRGESESGDAEALRRDPTLAWADVSAALDWLVQLDGVDTQRIALVGSSYGANLATTGMRLFDWPVCTLVCFSATAAGYRWPTGDAELKPMPSGLYMASAGEVERYAAEDTARRLAEETAGEYEVHIYNGPVHAQVIYALEPSAPILVAAWLEEQFSDKPGWSPPE